MAKCLTKMGMVEASTAAEVMAMYYAVSLCKTMGFQNLLLERDAKVVLEALKERVPSCSRSYGHLVEDTREVLQFFPQWQSEHVYKEAHIVAKEAVTWEENFPAIICNSVNLERAVCSCLIFSINESL